MRVLHLIDQATVDRQPLRVAQLADLIAHDAADEHRVWFIGGDATGYGVDLPVHRRMYPWFGLSATEPIRMRWNRRLIREFDVVHAWGWRLAEAARRVVGLPPILDDLVEPIGVATERSREDRAALRAEWDVAPGRFVVAAMTDEPAATDAMLAMRVLGLVGEAGMDVTLLTPPRADGLETARRIVAELGKPHLLTVHAEAALPWRVLAGCDAVIVPDDLASAPLTVAWAAAVGLPVLEVHPGALVMAPDWASGPLEPPAVTFDRPTPNNGEAAPRAGVFRGLPIRGLAIELRRLVGDAAARAAHGEPRDGPVAPPVGFTDWLSRQQARYRAAHAAPSAA